MKMKYSQILCNVVWAKGSWIQDDRIINQDVLKMHQNPFKNTHRKWSGREISKHTQFTRIDEQF